MASTQLQPPSTGEVISKASDGSLSVPDHPIIPHIEGDGIGGDVSAAMRKVVDAAVQRAFDGKRSIEWFDVYAGEAANEKYGNYLPDETLDAIRTYRVAIKGPLTTPVGGGFRSLNVTLRQLFDLYACIRPVRWITGVPSPVKEPQKLDVVIFRENTEDIYCGIEFEEGTPEAKKIIDFIDREYGQKIRPDSGVGIKPVSISGTKRLVRKAIEYAISHNRPKVTLVHKGNIMKFTEGAFRDWGYELAKEEFRDQIVTEDELWSEHDGKVPEGKILINDRIADSMFQQLLLRPDGKILVNDRIADSMFQQLLLRPDEYSVLATLNLNGDYLSDACAAQVGGLGLAPGANIGEEIALFEATHGTAPKYAGKNMVNPGSMILSAVMMLEHLGWDEAGDLIVKGIQDAIAAKTVTYDLERQMQGATKVSTSGFAQAIVDHM